MVQAYFDSKQFKSANQLIQQIITLYYSHNEASDDAFKQFISFKTH